MVVASPRWFADEVSRPPDDLLRGQGGIESDNLDHHPDAGPHRAWSPDAGGSLRVERQVTVPFPDVAASLLLIRTYLCPFAGLTPVERGVIAIAIETMPAPGAAYKGLVEWRDTILALPRGAG